MEPEFERYSSSLKPLLDASGSRYRHVPYSPFDWTSYPRIFDEGFLPRYSVEKNRTVGRLGQDQIPLLLLANLPVKGSSANLSLARYMISGFCSISRRHEILNCMGQFKMLAWLADSEKDKIIPRSITSRDSYSVALEMTSNIREIAGSGSTAGRYMREPEIQFRSALNVCSRMTATGCELPIDRRDLTHQAALMHLTSGTLKSSQVNLAHLFRLRNEEVLAAALEGREGTLTGKEKTKLKQLRNRLKNAKKTEVFHQDALNHMEQIYDLELALHQMSQQTDEKEEKEDIRTKLAQIRAFTRDIEQKMHRGKLSLLHSRLDDRIAFKMNPPLLQWDHRETEPLVVKEEEFSPHRQISLIEITPKVKADKARAGSKDPESLVIRSLFTTPADTIIRALDNIAPGASSALLLRLPSLSDPKKGGRHNLHDLRVRMLSPALLEELASVVVRWPFCPERFSPAGFSS